MPFQATDRAKLLRSVGQKPIVYEVPEELFLPVVNKHGYGKSMKITVYIIGKS